MLVSVIICSHSLERYLDTQEAVKSVMDQSYDDFEIILVVDRNVELYERFLDSCDDRTVVLLNHNRPGLSNSRNLGIRKSNGGIIAFLDDDAIADRDWLSHLVSGYEDETVIGCGGPIRPLWISGHARWIPEELYWVLGCTFKGFNNSRRKVRSNFGSNMSFRRIAFSHNSFNANYGIVDKSGVGEECEFSTRILNENPKLRIIHLPEAIVFHRIYNYRKSVKHLFNRCFQYGKAYSSLAKAINRLPADVGKDDMWMRGYLVFSAIPERMKNIVGPKGGPKRVEKAVSLFLLTLSSIVIVAGMGYAKASRATFAMSSIAAMLSIGYTEVLRGWKG